MGKSSAPPPPDPQQTASAQTGENVSTAIANAALAHTNQVTPNGSLTYNQTGSYKFSDPYTGQSYDIPTYTATTAYSPTGQKINDANQQTQLNLANIGNTQSQRIADTLGTPVDLSSGNVEKYMNDYMNPTFNSNWDNKQTALQTQLANQGVKLGSSAYDRAMGDFSQQRSQAESQNYSTNYQNAVNSILTSHNQPINEISALLSKSQVQQPAFASTPSSSIPTTDVAGLINQNYGQQVQNYNTKQQQLGGLFQLGGTVATAFI